MLRSDRILVRAIALVGFVAALAACGQKGVLFLPTEPAAAQRATLPEALRSLIAVPPRAVSSEAAPAAPVKVVQ